MLRMEGVNLRAQDVLERQVDHMLRLVDDLLDVSRITSGKIEIRKEHVELSSVVTRALEMSRPLLERRRNRLTIEVPERGLLIDGDPSRLAQIVSNLLTNAAKYSDPESSRLRISIAHTSSISARRVTSNFVGTATAAMTFPESSCSRLRRLRLNEYRPQ